LREKVINKYTEFLKISLQARVHRALSGEFCLVLFGLLLSGAMPYQFSMAWYWKLKKDRREGGAPSPFPASLGKLCHWFCHHLYKRVGYYSCHVFGLLYLLLQSFIFISKLSNNLP
jgi:hypothetical protein